MKPFARFPGGASPSRFASAVLFAGLLLSAAAAHAGQVRGHVLGPDGQPVFNRNQTHTFSYSGFWNHSPHSFTYGGDFFRQQLNTLSQQDARGTYIFSGSTTGNDFADFLLGVPGTSTIAFGNADKYYRQSRYDLFITDDWRVRTGLTLNLGVRWD